ncbi:DEAD/DEAH box helicase [Rahnella sp. PCH160]|uniref:DEAD/DEAH box helicase n=1 Tax=Rahnella sp. PCH160 TaxID=3447928 RepID=UPI0039FC5B61
MNSEYQRLDPRVQKWVFKQGWKDLREIQKKAIPHVLAGDRDVLISASTAAGKTEAFFLPACSAIADIHDSFGILYISPLKALINDQYRRLEGLGEMLDMEITPWHGDVAQSHKTKAKKNPSGILLITPESLEAMMIRSSGWMQLAFAKLAYVVIDEFHAFIGAERGMQLLSLLNRLEHLLGRTKAPIPRVALSATLGDLKTVPLALRANSSFPCETVTAANNDATFKVQVKGYLEPLIKDPASSSSAEQKVCDDLFRLCRGDSHLVFANSRKRTESLAASLSDLSENHVVPNEFFPHHGSLSRELREMLEKRLQKGNYPTTAICTMTLELGIDIGKVASVIQVTAPHSVSSLRQRMGRSGRRDSAPVLRMLITENELTPTSGLVDQLRLQLIQSIAMLRLLIANQWFEPADVQQPHYSTLFHQILAVTAQWGGVRAVQLFSQLCQTGPFQQVSGERFKKLLQHMGALQFLTQLSSGELVLGIEGERLVNQYTYFAVFKTPEEFRIVTGNRTLGSVPMDSPVIPEQHIIFAGKRWKVIEINAEAKVIYVTETKGGKPPIFGGEGMSVHDVVRQEMYKIFSEGDYRIATGEHKKDFADTTARKLFDEGRYYFEANNLANERIIQNGGYVYIIPWLGDRAVNTLSALLLYCGFRSGAFAGVIEIANAKVSDVRKSLSLMLQQGLPSETELASRVEEKHLEKFDEFLPEDLLTESYGLRVFDIKSVQAWLMAELSGNPVVE